MNFTRSQIEERYEQLPDSLKDAIFSNEISEFVLDTAEHYKLTDEQISLFSGAIGNVILGFIRIDDLQKELVDFGISQNIVKSIVSKVNESIFSPIRSEIEQVYSPLPSSAQREQSTPISQQQKPFEIPAHERRVELRFKPGTGREQVLPPQPPTTNASSQLRNAPYTINVQQHITPQKSTAEGAPFMLHQETELEPILESPKAPALPRAEFSRRATPPEIKVQFSDEEKRKITSGSSTPKPPQQFVRYTIPALPPRIVPRPTPPPPAPPAEKIVDLSAFKKMPLAKPSSPPNSGPQVDGNIVDLR